MCYVSNVCMFFAGLKGVALRIGKYSLSLDFKLFSPAYNVFCAFQVEQLRH